MPDAPDFLFENAMRARGIINIAGTDEAGRGPLAGPVVAAAVILPLTLSAQAKLDLAALTDSKKLTETKRVRLFEAVYKHAQATATVSISARSIDESDILSASLNAMRLAILALSNPVNGVLVDGDKLIRNLPPTIYQQAIIKGDGRSLSIAAASIIAKVTRDRMMQRLAEQHSAYGLQGHKGYGSAAHRAAIDINGGVKRVHRFSFKPLRRDELLI